MQSICHFCRFLPISRDWTQQLIRAVSCALSSLFCLLLPEDFVFIAHPRWALWTVVVSILLQQETQQLLANLTLKLNQLPFKKSRKLQWKSVKSNTTEAQHILLSVWVCDLTHSGLIPPLNQTRFLNRKCAGHFHWIRWWGFLLKSWEFHNLCQLVRLHIWH